MAEYEAGYKFGRFRIEGVLGRGGMAVVYRAWEDKTERWVALKVITPNLAAEADFRRRFLREAQHASLEHPSIVTVYSSDEYEGKLFIAMRLVDGTDLATYLREHGPLDFAEALHIARPIADALDSAHEHGLVHRDVKPANILIGRPSHGRPSAAYLTDFGIVHEAGRDLSMVGGIVGTVDYMSPEQIAGKMVDGCADQYSLACTLFEMLCGKAPFSGRASMHATIYAHVYEAPPAVSSLRADAPPGVDAVIARGLAKDPESRYPACLALVDAARDALAAEPAPQAAAEPRNEPPPTLADPRRGVAEPPADLPAPRRFRRRLRTSDVERRQVPTPIAPQSATAPPPSAAAPPTVVSSTLAATSTSDRASEPSAAMAPPLAATTATPADPSTLPAVAGPPLSPTSGSPAPTTHGLRTRRDRRSAPTSVRRAATTHGARRARPSRAALLASVATLAVVGVAAGAWYASSGSAPVRTIPTQTTSVTEPVPPPPPPAPIPVPAKPGWPPADSAAAILRFAATPGRLDNQARYQVDAGDQLFTVTVTQRRGKATVDVPRTTGADRGAPVLFHLWARFDIRGTGEPRFEVGCFRPVGLGLTCLRGGQTQLRNAKLLQQLQRLVKFVSIAASPDLRALATNGRATVQGKRRCARSPAAQLPPLLLCVQRAGVVTEARTQQTHLTLKALRLNPPETEIQEPH